MKEMNLKDCIAEILRTHESHFEHLKRVYDEKCEPKHPIFYDKIISKCVNLAFCIKEMSVKEESPRMYDVTAQIITLGDTMEHSVCLPVFAHSPALALDIFDKKIRTMYAGIHWDNVGNSYERNDVVIYDIKVRERKG